MAIQIQPYTSDWTPAVHGFNRRLAAGGVPAEFRFPESSVAQWLPKLPGRTIYQDYYLATEGDEVRGAYILKHQPFWIGGRTERVAYYHLPISEGIVNRRYSGVGVQMLRSALKAEPSLFCLGMGGMDRPLPLMLKAMRWSMCSVPFLFKVHRPARFLREIAPLRTTWPRRVAADLAAWTGAGWVAMTALQRSRTNGAGRGTAAECVERFGCWADEVWERARSEYRFIAARDTATLGILYPPSHGFLPLKVTRGASTVGWAVVRDTQMSGSKYFGDMRVGSIADCLAAPAEAGAVVHAATECLFDRGVDLVVSNQAHASWTSALERNGYLKGPSNFVFAASPALAAHVAPFESVQSELFLNRGDGDGPVNL